MTRKERRQFAMLLRVRDFGDTHGDRFSASSAAQATFSAVNAAIDTLIATDVMKMSASVSKRSDRKATARRALTALLMGASQLARVLRARGRTVPPFELPVSKSDQALLTAGRQFAQDAIPFDVEFTGHGVGPAQISDATTAFETALRDKGMSRAGHTEARTRIRDQISGALLDVRRLDLIVNNDLAGDNVTQTVWKQVRRVEYARGPRAIEAQEPTPALTLVPPQAA